jgi:hypothetical protein
MMSRHWTISTGRHFQNGHHNTAKIQHCSISSKFDMMSRIDSLHWKISTIRDIISNFDDIEQCWIFAVLWWPFWKWRPVEIVQCRDIIIYPHIKFWWYRTMLNFCSIVAFHVGRLWCPELIPDIEKFQNGHHNTAQIQHCPISKTFHMWVAYDVLNWFLTSKNFYRSPFSKWPKFFDVRNQFGTP